MVSSASITGAQSLSLIHILVGTGGDRKNTFNISTTSGFVIAGAGYKVAKHGNYAATSVSGASNVIKNHGDVYKRQLLPFYF